MIKKDTLIIIIFLIGPFFIDQINGLIKAKLGIDISISQYYKFATYLLIIIYILMKDNSKKYSFIIIGLVTLAFLNTLSNSLYGESSLDSLSKDLTYIFKLSIFPLTYFATRIYFNIKGSIWNEKIIFKIFIFILASLLIAQSLTPLGFGISTYGENKEGEAIGWSGYFISGNELSALFVIIFSVSSYYALLSPNSVITIIILLMGILSGCFLGTKTAILGAFVIIFTNYLLIKLYNKKLLSFTGFDIKLTALFSFFLLTGLIFIDKIFALIAPIYNRYIYFSTIKDNSVYGSRTARVEPLIEDYKNSRIIQQLFGRGYAYIKSRTIGETRFSITEIDIFDLLYITGIAGVILIYGIWIYFLLKSASSFNQRKSQLAIPITISLFILIINSMIAGHIMYATLTHVFLGFIVGYLFSLISISPEKIQNENPDHFQHVSV